MLEEDQSVYRNRFISVTKVLNRSKFEQSRLSKFVPKGNI
jgi:hypothetical protein